MKDKQLSSILSYTLITFLLLAFQSMNAFSFWGVYPDLALILVIIFSFSRGSFSGEIFGFIVGFSLDLMSGTLFGLNAFVFTLIGSLSSLFQKLVKISTIIVFIIYLSLSTTIKYILYTVFYSLYDNTSLVDWYFLVKIPSEILLNSILGVLIYILIARIDVRDNYDWF